MDSPLRFLVPSKGRIGDQTLAFLEACGLPVQRPNPRQYTGTLPGVPEAIVLFQRAWQMVEQIRNGDADAGITGFDIFSELRQEGDELILVVPDLGYSKGKLALAVPEDWLDVWTLTDLAEVALEFREAGRVLRIATTFPKLTREFLFQQGITYFQIVAAEGGLEAAPTLGYADVIVDLVSTGTTLKENRLRMLENGTLLTTQACLVGNRRQLRHHAAKREALRYILEHIEASRRVQSYASVTANIRGESAAAVAARLAQFPAVSGLLGPTVAQVYPREACHSEHWFAVTVLVKAADLLAAVESLRVAGCASVSVSTPQYLFAARCELYENLLQTLGLRQADATELPARTGQGER